MTQLIDEKWKIKNQLLVTEMDVFWWIEEFRFYRARMMQLTNGIAPASDY